MTDLIDRLKEHKEWAEANIYEVPITLPDDIGEAIEALPKKGCKQCKWINEPSISLRCRDCRGSEDYPNFEFEYLKPKKGKWIDFNPSDPLDPRMKCSYCGGVELPKTTWAACPLCGADMKGENDDK